MIRRGRPASEAQLTVDRQLVTARGGIATFGPPKTKRSYRSVPLADPVVEALARHVEAHGSGRDALLLHCVDGRPVSPQYFGSTRRKLRDRAGLPDARFHDTRHTFASVLLSGGVSVTAAAEYDRARSAVESAFSCHGRVRLTRSSRL